MIASERHIDTLIVGAGPTGLATAYGLQGDTVIVERGDDVGGLCRSLHRDGGVFDIGGHSFHTPHPEVVELLERLMGSPLYRQRRDARIYTHGQLIRYPFQKFYQDIHDAELVRRCEEGLGDRVGDAHLAADYEEFILRQFGQGIADAFMLPYNRKLWARDLKQISTEWTSQRVAAPRGDVDRFLTSGGGGERKPLESDSWVGYPSQGGFEEMYRAFVPHVPEVQLRSEIVHIDPAARTAVTADDRTFRWNTLVSTIPLPELVGIINGVPRAVVDAAGRLEYISLRVQLLLTAAPLETEIQRIYVSDPEIPPHKIAINHNSSDWLRQRPRHAIMAEVAYSEFKPVDFDQIAPRTIEALCDAGVLRSPSDIIWQDQLDVKYGYPVYTHARLELIAQVRDWLRQHDIHTIGRFGAWEYINSDACIVGGLRLASELREHDARSMV